MELKGKVAVVTGARSGLGLGTLNMLVAEGARALALDLWKPEDDALPDQTNVLRVSCNVASAEEVEAAFAAIPPDWGVPRILVNCAGILGPARVFTIDKVTGRAQPRPLDPFRHVLDVNLIGTFNTIRLFAAALSEQEPVTDDGERGVIVNTASVAAYEALSAQAAYGASKAAVASMTLPLARELARYGIRVMSLAPGTFRTGMYDVVPTHTRKTLIDDVPFPCRPGRPDEFAHMVRAIVENSMMNGSVVRVDGGVRMREPVAQRESKV